MAFPAYLSSGGVPASGGSVSWRSHGLKMEDRRCRRPDVDVEHNGMVKDRRNFPKSHGTFTRSHATIYRLILSTVWIYTRMFTFGFPEKIEVTSQEHFLVNCAGWLCDESGREDWWRWYPTERNVPPSETTSMLEASPTQRRIRWGYESLQAGSKFSMWLHQKPTVLSMI